MAATIFQTFVASDDASTTLVQLKRLHGLMPYFVLKGILRVSNPMAMIRGQSSAVFRECDGWADALVTDALYSAQVSSTSSSLVRSEVRVSFNGQCPLSPPASCPARR